MNPKTKTTRQTKAIGLRSVWIFDQEEGKKEMEDKIPKKSVDLSRTKARGKEHSSKIHSHTVVWIGKCWSTRREREPLLNTKITRISMILHNEWWNIGKHGSFCRLRRDGRVIKRHSDVHCTTTTRKYANLMLSVSAERTNQRTNGWMNEGECVCVNKRTQSTEWHKNEVNISSKITAALDWNVFEPRNECRLHLGEWTSEWMNEWMSDKETETSDRETEIETETSDRERKAEKSWCGANLWPSVCHPIAQFLFI